jgi:hypothetical protein
MLHNQTENGGHYGVSPWPDGPGVLVQIMEGFSHLKTGWSAQARELLTYDEAIHLADLLHAAVKQAEGKESHIEDYIIS